MIPIQKIIITSGPTREWIDPVRYISNASSGKMGFCLAEIFSTLGLELVYIQGLTESRYSDPKNSRVVNVETTLQLRDAVLAELESNTLLIMAAAPADFRPIMVSSQKIKKNKESGISQGLLLELEENPDILFQVQEDIQYHHYNNVIRIGFAAETENLSQSAQEKLTKKSLDGIIGNQVGDGQGFGEVSSSLLFFWKGQEVPERLGPASKEVLAKLIFESLLMRFPSLSRESKSKIDSQ